MSGTVSRKRFLTPFPTRGATLLAWTVAIAVVWLYGLPLLGSRPAIQRYIRENESRGIDPSAKFYTELPGMADFFDHTDTARRRHATAFGE
ncbi:MAG TPA: hypothetical protein VGG30_05575 [Pirellulales bacterium]